MERLEALQVLSGEVSSSLDNTICIWDANTGKLIAGPFEGHTGRVLSATYSPDARWVASGSEDRKIRIWDVQRSEIVTGPVKSAKSYGAPIAFSPDCKRVITVSHSLGETTFCNWNTETGEIVAVCPIGQATYLD
jgi:WD40 repeat protein